MKEKSEIRREAAARRALLHETVDAHPAIELLDDELKPHAGHAISFYMPIRSELDPRPAMVRAVLRGPVLLPVMQGLAAPLRFRHWQPGVRLEWDRHGIESPADTEEGAPEVLVVPLLAFDGRGHRLGYGAGLYDRTLAVLRETRPVIAIGLAYAGQEVDRLPILDTDEPLETIVTEAGVRRFA